MYGLAKRRRSGGDPRREPGPQQRPRCRAALGPAGQQPPSNRSRTPRGVRDADHPRITPEQLVRSLAVENTSHRPLVPPASPATARRSRWIQRLLLGVDRASRRRRGARTGARGMMLDDLGHARPVGVAPLVCAKPGKRAVNAWRRWSRPSVADSATTAEESIPPLSEVPTATSPRSRSRIESRSSSRSSGSRPRSGRHLDAFRRQ